MTPNKPRGGSGKYSPRFSCQRCKPQHSVGMEDMYKAVAVKLKDVKLTGREHKILVVTEWHEFKKDSEAFDEALRHIAALKGTNKTDIEACEERLNEMKYGDKKAPQKDIDGEKRKWSRLDEERESLLKREGEIGRESMQRYNDLDAFLELCKNGSCYWTKAEPDKKRILADMIVSNAVIDGDKVASASLAEPFAEWAKRDENLDGREDRTKSETVSILRKAFLNIKNIIQENDTSKAIERLSLAFC